MKKSQNGFVLLSVLLITSFSTFYAFSAISGNQLQERIGGHQQKSMNARMMAEKGVFEAFDYINTGMHNTVSRSVITAALPGDVSDAQFTILPAEYNSAAVPTYITFVSEGTADGATAFIKATIAVTPGGNLPGFSKAVVGCEGVTLSGSGIIDSFDSALGDYNTESTDANGDPILDENSNPVMNIGDEGDTKTINEGADITLTGASPIHGNVESTGSFTSGGSSFVKGNVSANQDVTINATDSNGSTSVTQGINSGRDATVNNNAIIKGGVKAKDSFTGNVDDGVNTLIFGGVATGDYGRGPVATETCDDIGIAEKVTGFEGLTSGGKDMGPDGSPIYNWDFSLDATKNNHGVEFNFTSTSAEYLNPNFGGEGESLKSSYTGETRSVPFLSETPENVHVFDHFKLSNQDIVISGDIPVKILVTGDFTAENASKIKVERGSQLVIVVLGKITTTDGFRITEVGDPNADALATSSPVEFYSAHASENETDLAVNLQGQELSATIHAALGHVSVNGSAGLKGAIRGKTVAVSGGNAGNGALNTGVHFDEKLGRDNQGPTEFDAIIKYVSVHDFYPEPE